MTDLTLNLFTWYVYVEKGKRLVHIKPSYKGLDSSSRTEVVDIILLRGLVDFTLSLLTQTRLFLVVITYKLITFQSFYNE